jgi:beta-xylosidase
MLKYSLLIILILCVVCAGGLASAEDQNTQTKESERVVFRDDFTGTSLRPEWKLLREDSDRWTLYENEYLLIITASSKGGLKNALEYNAALPKNCEITLKVQSPPIYDEQYVVMNLTQDGKNYLWFGVEGDGSMSFSKILRGEESEIRRGVGDLTAEKPIYLRLRKQGIHYTASYSLDGTTWSKVGTHLFLNFNGSPRVYTYIKEGWARPEVGVYLDYFEIKALD